MTLLQGMTLHTLVKTNLPKLVLTFFLTKTFARQGMEWNEMGWDGIGGFKVGVYVWWSRGLEVFVLE